VSAPGGDWDYSKNMITTVNNNGCKDATVGTSFAAALVSGVLALVLQANGDLSWRDVQDILALTSQHVTPSHSSWTKNAAGLNHSDRFGFGRIDAAAAVAMALKRKETPLDCNRPHASCSFLQGVDSIIPDGDATGIASTIYAANCSTLVSIQHVVVYVTAEHKHRGDLAISLTHPSGFSSPLTYERSEDGDDFTNWKFMTLKSWGENPTGGQWSLRIADNQLPHTPGSKSGGIWKSWALKMYGDCSHGLGGPASNQGREIPTCHTTKQSSCEKIILSAESTTTKDYDAMGQASSLCPSSD
jgi:subtilisin-like proprotein convertase family protein